MDKNKIAVGLFNKLASEYQNKFMDVSLYHDTFDVFCAAIKKKGAEVLELACGPGNITKYLLSKRPDLKILGTDLAPNMIALAKQNNPAAEFELMDCRNIGTLPKKYDALLCGFCFPYLDKQETEKLIKNTAALLNNNGVIYISTIEDAYANSAFKKGSTSEEIFMHYYLESDLNPLLTKSGFKINYVKRIKSEMADGGAVTDLIMIAQK